MFFNSKLSEKCIGFTMICPMCVFIVLIFQSHNPHVIYFGFKPNLTSIYDQKQIQLKITEGTIFLFYNKLTYKIQKL